MTNLEPELSVKDLLATTAEDTESLEEIKFGEKSETIFLINQFVEEIPDAMVSLLRKSILDHWGKRHMAHARNNSVSEWTAF